MSKIQRDAARVLSERDIMPVVTWGPGEQPGTIVVDATNHFLYLVQGGGRAIRYGVGVGRQGFGWSGVASRFIVRLLFA